jgi:hypothetical protein
MANFTIDYDITMSGCIDVEANTEEEARQIALKKLKNDPYYFARRATHHVNTKITDIY